MSGHLHMAICCVIELLDVLDLLAVGGDLSQKRLLLAYSMGIFPWYSEAEPILWWSPDPRLVLYPGELRISKSLLKTIKRELLVHGLVFKLKILWIFKSSITGNTLSILLLN